MGPQIYGVSGRKADKYIRITFDIKRLRESRIVNFTGYSWSDSKWQIGMTMLRNSGSKVVVHDSDYLACDEYIETLKANKHEVVFVLGKSNDWRNQTHPMSKCAASNKRIRNAFKKLKAAGVKVRKFQDLSALTRYLDKAVQGE